MRRLIDLNVLLALSTDRISHHCQVRSWVEALADTEILSISRPVQMGFLRLLSSPAVMGDETLTLPQAWTIYARLLASGRFAFAFDPPKLDVIWAEYCRPFGKSPKIVMDAYLAAFAVAGQYHLITLDQAFHQFKGLTWEIPGHSDHKG